MENRYSVHPEQVKRFTTEELRSHFLMDSLFTENKLTMYYSHEDRVVIGGAAPGQSELKLDAGDFLKTDFFLERREIGIINVGQPGAVRVGDDEYVLQTKDFSLYWNGQSGCIVFKPERGKSEVLLRLRLRPQKLSDTKSRPI